ncbi:hypothetical protein ACP70R_015226 [Stipagrostis hirtigluma subsp. patula]
MSPLQLLFMHMPELPPFHTDSDDTVLLISFVTAGKKRQDVTRHSSA